MTQDGELRKLFRENLVRGWHWQSVETGGTGRGVPDANFCRDGVEGWIEFKLARGRRAGLRPEQIGWIAARSRAGGRVFVAVRRKTGSGDELRLYLGDSVRELASRGIPEGPSPLLVETGGPNLWNWEKIECELTS